MTIADLDNLLMKSYSNIGRFYQEMTGKSKDDLAVKLYSTASIAMAADAVYMLSDPISSFLNLTISGICAANAYSTSNKMKLTENLPTPIEPMRHMLTLSLNGIGGIFLTSSSLALLLNSYATHDYSNIKNEVDSLVFGVSNLLFLSAHYLTIVDIGPPSGKTLMSRVKDYVKSHLPGPIFQPSPSPV